MLLHEFGLLIAVATPIFLIIALQVFLFISGERGTLLLPWPARYPVMDAEAALDAVEQNVATEAPAEPREDELRQAA